MSISQYIKEIGRGKDGARSLSREQAHDLMSQVLDGRVTDLELGAFAIGMRIKGETTEELAGFLQATRERCLPLASAEPVVLLPSYNGARKLPNLTALVARLLAREGVPVLVHGMPEDRTRVTTAEIFEALGLPGADDADGVATAWARGEPACIRTDRLCTPLARLLDARWTIGLRNPAHTVAKLLDLGAGATALRVVNFTHPEYGRTLTEFLQATQAHAMLMRGTEGEPVADPRRSPRLDVFIDGEPRADLSVPAHEGVLREVPVLPKSCDAPTTAAYIRAVLDGDEPVPPALQRQVQALVAARGALQKAPPRSA